MYYVYASHVTVVTIGTPVYPINLGGLQVLNLGHVIFDRPAYHTERYILPVGYQSRRSYFSIKQPTSRCMYTCQILDGGDAPTVSECYWYSNYLVIVQFEVRSEEDPGHPIRGTSSSSCHAILLKAINKARYVLVKIVYMTYNHVIHQWQGCY